MTRFAAALALCILSPAAANTANAQDAMQWFYSAAIAANPLDTRLVLVYGVPETDNTRVAITCAIGANWVYADMRLAADIGGLEDGTAVLLTIGRDDMAAGLDADVFRPQTEEGFWGVRAAVPLDDPLWTILSGPHHVRYFVGEAEAMTLGTDGARDTIAAFLRDCSMIDALEAEPQKGH